jgi:hypothetical protein
LSVHQDNKALVLQFYAALEHATPATVAAVLAEYTSEDYQFYGVYPWGELHGAGAVAEALWQPLLSSWQALQRRQDIFMAGTSEIDGAQWVTSMGHFMGLRDEPWLGIPATRKIGFLRYADFNCVRDGKICRTGFFCDIISVMSQAGCNPLPAQTGASIITPGPRTHDGLQFAPQDPAEAVETLEVLNRMIADLDELNRSGNDHCPPELLAQSWHEDMAWYGPEGIGATFTISRYQEQHQLPFRRGLKDKVYNGHVCRYAEGNYACFFGWPNLTHTPTGGFLGLPGNELRVDMRVVDVYRREGDKLAENWVLIDLPWWLKQQGLDIFERLDDG